MRPASLLALLTVSAATVSTSPVGAQPVNIRSCASIPNPYERADCVRRGGAYSRRVGRLDGTSHLSSCGDYPSA
jgi:hypothetical protein